MIRVLAVVVLLALPSPLLAHHSVTATYDNTKPITITGTVTRVEWRNPHVNIYLTVKSDDGNVSTRMIQIAGVGRLTQSGVDKNQFSIGATVTFEAWLPKNPSDVALAGRTVKLADGRSLDVSDAWGMRQ